MTQEQTRTAGQEVAGVSPTSIEDFLDAVWNSSPIAWMPRVSTGAAQRSIRIEEIADKDALVVRAEIPGVDPERDVSVTVDGDVLTITAERQTSETGGKEGFRSEFRYGRFARSLRLPPSADPAGLTATYKDGVVEVRIPTDDTRSAPKRIEISRA